MGDHVGGGRQRQPPRNLPGDSFSAFARPALFGVHLLHRLQGQLRRIQGDGAGALRRAAIRETHSRPSDRSEAGRLVPARHVLFRLLHRLDDDQRPVRRIVRRAGAQPGSAADAVSHGRRGLDPGGAGRSGAAADAQPRQADRIEKPLPRRRRGAELRRQRQGAARRPFREHLDPAGGRRCRRRGRRGAGRLSPLQGPAAHRPTAPTAWPAPISARISRRPRSSGG